MAVKPRVLESRSEQNQTTHESDVAATKVVTPGRFIKNTAGARTILNADAQGERVIGVALESMYPGSDAARVTDFDNYIAGDPAPWCAYTDGFVVVELGSQVETAADYDLDTKITTTATGKAEKAATGDFVAGVDPEFVTYGGVNYVRFRPAWDSGEVV